MKIVLDTQRITGFISRRLATRRARITTAVGLSLVPMMVYAVTKPNTFTDGTVISASQMNSNFDTIYNAVTALEGIRDTAPATCKDILAQNAKAADGLFWIDPDGAGNLRPFQVWCDMSGGGWARVDENSHYPFAIHTEAERSQTYDYELSTAQINAIRAKSTEGKQDWACQTVGVGNVYNLIGWDGTAVAFTTCYAPDNAAYVSSSGSFTTLARLPFKEWRSYDCGDVTEACQHNVGPAYFR